MNPSIDPHLKLEDDRWNKISMPSINETSITEVIRKERPDGIFLSCGGKRALNYCVELHKSGFLQKYSCNV